MIKRFLVTVTIFLLILVPLVGTSQTTGGSATRGDNLGNHSATMDLDMNLFNITDVNSISNGASPLAIITSGALSLNGGLVTITAGTVGFLDGNWVIGNSNGSPIIVRNDVEPVTDCSFKLGETNRRFNAVHLCDTGGVFFGDASDNIWFSGDGAGNIRFSGNLVPDGSNLHSIGTLAEPVADLFLDASSLHLGSNHVTSTSVRPFWNNIGIVLLPDLTSGGFFTNGVYTNSPASTATAYMFAPPGNNSASSEWTMVLSGTGNKIGAHPFPPFPASTAPHTVIAGGENNTATHNHGFLGGGEDNNLDRSNWGVLAGGRGNNSTGNWGVLVGGDMNSKVSSIGPANTLVAGRNNVNASDLGGFLGGGINNLSAGDYSVLVGGLDQETAGDYSFLGGGRVGSANGNYSTVPGGRNNDADGNYGTSIGGRQNSAGGNYSISGGRRAIADENSTFVMSQDDTTNFEAQNSNIAIFRYDNGMGIGTNDPQAMLHVDGDAIIEGDLTVNSNTIRFAGTPVTISVESNCLHTESLSLGTNSACADIISSDSNSVNPNAIWTIPAIRDYISAQLSLVNVGIYTRTAQTTNNVTSSSTTTVSEITISNVPPGEYLANFNASVMKNGGSNPLQLRFEVGDVPDFSSERTYEAGNGDSSVLILTDKLVLVATNDVSVEVNLEDTPGDYDVTKKFFSLTRMMELN